MVKLNKKKVIVIAVVTVLAVGIYWYTTTSSAAIVNDATKDGLPATLDLTKLAYNSGKVDGTYNGVYQFYLNTDGTISLASKDKKFEYMYDAKGVFMKKVATPA